MLLPLIYLMGKQDEKLRSQSSQSHVCLAAPTVTLSLLDVCSSYADLVIIDNTLIISSPYNFFVLSRGQSQ
jgi:hypothetical protein